MEHSFEVSGSTAIEDRLQKGVPDAIAHIRKAGIKLWVLTGDKIETALDVGFSSGLLDDTSQYHVIDRITELDKYVKASALIVSGDALAQIMASQSLKQKFVEMVDSASSVIACRVSPKQKAEIVLMMKEQHPETKTLAIGDGSNDVNMITAAHVGVGISGLEG